MFFSVVIPTYNRLHLLRDTLASVWQQRFTNYEVVVADDGSTDGTQAYLTELGDRVRVVRQANRGPGAARNDGLREARGEYVALLDSDDLWFPWTLEVFARAIDEYKRPSIVGGHFIEFLDSKQLHGVREEAYEVAWFPDYLASSRFPYYVGSGTCVLRREVFKAAKFLEDRLTAEDHDLALQLGTHPGFVRLRSPVTLAWRRHRASETGDLLRNVSGAARLLAREKAGAYPGGSIRADERHRILSRHVRPEGIVCLKNLELKRGWQMYVSTLWWNIVLGYWKYVIGFPMLSALAFCKRVVLAERSRTGRASLSGEK